MYSKIKESRSFSHSSSGERSDSGDESDSSSETNTVTEYDSPVSKSSPNSKTRNHPESSKTKTQINKLYRASTIKKGKEATKDAQPLSTVSKNKSSKAWKSRRNNSNSYDYETIIGIHLYRTSTLKFKRYIRAPRVKVSIFNVQDRCLAKKSDINRNVVMNSEPDHVDYILPILSKEGKLSDDGSFSFRFDENLIINEDIDYIRDENVILIFEILDTVVVNFKTRWKLRNSDGWHHICWAFLKLNSSQNSHINKRRTLQLYKYRKSKRNSPILEQCFDAKRKRYPGTIEVAIKEIQYEQEDVELSRPHTALQKDKQSSLSVQQEKARLEDGEANFIITGRNNDGSLQSSKTGRILPLIRLRNIFRWRARFECPTQEIIRKQLTRKCSVCCFSEDGTTLAYALEDGAAELDATAISTDIVIAQVPGMVQQYILKGHSNAVHCLRWMPASFDKQVLLSASEDHTCILWFLASEGNYSLQVLPHPCSISTADFLLQHDKDEKENMSYSFGIGSGGSDGILYVWRVKEIMKSSSAEEVAPAATVPQPRQQEVHLEQEIPRHDARIVGIEFSRKFRKIYSADVGGTVIEWIVQKPGEDNVGRSPGWTDSRSFSIPAGLYGLQIIDRLSRSACTILYASVISKVANRRGSKVATLYKIDTKSGRHSEIVTRNISPALIKSITFSFVVTSTDSSDTSYVLFTSEANEITCLNLKSDTEIEKIVINTTKMPRSAVAKTKDMQSTCIQAVDIVARTAMDAEKNVLAVFLASRERPMENYVFLYGPQTPVDNIKTATESKRNRRQDEMHRHVCGDLAASKHSSSISSSSSSDCKNISRLTSFFNEVLDKCDRIIRYGSSASSGYKLAANTDDTNSAIDVDVNDDANSDRTSIKSDRTFTIDNISADGNRAEASKDDRTFSIDDEQAGQRKVKEDDTFTVEKHGGGDRKPRNIYDTDVSEDLESSN